MQKDKVKHQLKSIDSIVGLPNISIKFFYC